MSALFKDLESPSGPTMAASDRPMVQPVLASDKSSVWGRLTDERDRIFGTLEQLVREHLPGAMVVRSNTGVYPVEISIKCWFGGTGMSERVDVRIVLKPRPHRRHPIEYVVHLDDRGRRPRIWRMPALENSALERLVEAVKSSGESWPDRSRRLWLNPVVGVVPDLVHWGSHVALAGAVMAALASPLGSALADAVATVHSTTVSLLEPLLPNDVEIQYFLGLFALIAGFAAWLRMRTAGLRRAVIVGAAVIAFATQPGGLLVGMLVDATHPAAAVVDGSGDGLDEADSGTSVAAEPLADSRPSAHLPLVLSLLLWYALRRWDIARTVVVYNEGRPQAMPRSLRVADYWATVVEGLGDLVQETRQRFVAEIRSNAHPELTVASESIVALGPDGKEEREQLVLTFRRAIIFCHVYVYGANLYAGWDAHLNVGQWAEQEVARGMKGLTSALSVRSVEPTWQNVSEYDVHDLNCLVEWVHAALAAVLKQLAAERRIDQEIDFKIQRAQRNSLFQQDSDDGKRSGLLRGLRRVA